jgi:uncharacterized protein YnzC (UPF0291/DUF896 family)
MKNQPPTIQATKVGTSDSLAKEEVRTLSEHALLRQKFLDMHRDALLSEIKQVEVPEDVFRAMIPEGTNVMFQDIRVFVEGTLHDTLEYEKMSAEQRLFGHTKVK